jgi:3-methyladenine DNA glycosylase Mpg
MYLMIKGDATAPTIKPITAMANSSSVNERNDTSLLIRALEFAAGKHRMQRRKNEDASRRPQKPVRPPWAFVLHQA